MLLSIERVIAWYIYEYSALNISPRCQQRQLEVNAPLPQLNKFSNFFNVFDSGVCGRLSQTLVRARPGNWRYWLRQVAGSHAIGGIENEGRALIGCWGNAPTNSSSRGGAWDAGHRLSIDCRSSSCEGIRTRCHLRFVSEYFLSISRQETC